MGQPFNLHIVSFIPVLLDLLDLLDLLYFMYLFYVLYRTKIV